MYAASKFEMRVNVNSNDFYRNSRFIDMNIIFSYTIDKNNKHHSDLKYKDWTLDLQLSSGKDSWYLTIFEKIVV